MRGTPYSSLLSNALHSQNPRGKLASVENYFVPSRLLFDISSESMNNLYAPDNHPLPGKALGSFLCFISLTDVVLCIDGGFQC